MPVDQKIAVRCVLVLTYAGFNQRSVRESGEALGEKRARFIAIASDSIVRIGIEVRAVSVERQLKPAILEIGNCVCAMFVRNVRPHGHVRWSEARVAGWRAKEINLLTRGATMSTEEFRENFR